MGGLYLPLAFSSYSCLSSWFSPGLTPHIIQWLSGEQAQPGATCPSLSPARHSQLPKWTMKCLVFCNHRKKHRFPETRSQESQPDGRDEVKDSTHSAQNTWRMLHLRPQNTLKAFHTQPGTLSPARCWKLWIKNHVNLRCSYSPPCLGISALAT